MRNAAKWLTSPPALAGFWAGLLQGFVVLGVGGRLMMSIISWVAGEPPDWSFVGSMQVIVLGAAMGPPAGLIYAAMKSRLPGPAAMRGLTFGVLNGLFWVGVYYARPAGPIELNAAPVLGASLFGGLLVAFGVALALTEQWLEQGDATTSRRRGSMAAVIGVIAIGSAALALFALVSR